MNVTSLVRFTFSLLERYFLLVYYSPGFLSGNVHAFFFFTYRDDVVSEQQNKTKQPPSPTDSLLFTVLHIIILHVAFT